MSVSLSRPDPTSPSSVSEAGFSTVRRGFDPSEVRAFLTSVAAEIRRLNDQTHRLQAELADANARARRPIEIDDATVTRFLGEEATRVLQTARDSASGIKIRAEEGAAELLREAADQAAEVRRAAEVQTAQIRQDGAAEAESIVAQAKSEGRSMVAEARAYRERVLADLDRRTTMARQQIDELEQARQRLLQVFERSRLVAIDVSAELESLRPPTELVDLSPVTGPVPVIVPASSRPLPRARASEPRAERDHADDPDETRDGSPGATAGPEDRSQTPTADYMLEMARRRITAEPHSTANGVLITSGTTESSGADGSPRNGEGSSDRSQSSRHGTNVVDLFPGDDDLDDADGAAASADVDPDLGRVEEPDTDWRVDDVDHQSRHESDDDGDIDVEAELDEADADAGADDTGSERSAADNGTDSVDVDESNVGNADVDSADVETPDADSPADSTVTADVDGSTDVDEIAAGADDQDDASADDVEHDDQHTGVATTESTATDTAQQAAAGGDPAQNASEEVVVDHTDDDADASPDADDDIAEAADQTGNDHDDHDVDDIFARLRREVVDPVSQSSDGESDALEDEVAGGAQSTADTVSSTEAVDTVSGGTFADLTDTETASDHQPAVTEASITEAIIVESIEIDSTEIGQQSDGSVADAEVDDQVAVPAEFAARDDTVALVAGAAGRQIKRLMGDEQNGALHRLGQKEPVTTVDELVGTAKDQAKGYHDLIADAMLDGAIAGAAAVGRKDSANLRRTLGKGTATKPIFQILDDGVVAPLRVRLQRAIAETGGDNVELTQRVRSIYREIKTQVVDSAMTEMAVAAYGTGVTKGVKSGTPLVWSVDPRHRACPDCEDNSLSPPVPAGEGFPTGHVGAPAHPGCTCLTLPSTD